MKDVKNGFKQFYGVDEEGKPKLFPVKDAALAEQIAGLESAKLIQDHQNVVVGVE